MDQTGRQTDKATHWKTAVHDVGDNWAILKGALPTFIKELKMKKEIAPTTGSEHYQIHVRCHTQQRGSKLYGWIKATKWFAVIGDTHIQNSIDYISKVETTAPGANVETRQGEQYLRVHELLLQIAGFWECELGYKDTPHGPTLVVTDVNNWENITLRMVDQDLNWANKLSNPMLRRMWNEWKFAFLRRVEEFAEQTLGAYYIEGPGNQSCPADSLEDSEVPPEIEEEFSSYSIV